MQPALLETVVRPEQELSCLLAEPSAAVARRAAESFDQQAGPLAGRLVLHGAGGLGRRTLRGLRALGLEPLAFTDCNPALWGQAVDGLTVLEPAMAAARFGDSAVFLVTVWRAGGGHRFEVTQRWLNEAGCACVLPAAVLFWKHPAVFLDFYCLDLPQRLCDQRLAIERAFALLADEPSRVEYVAQIRWRLHLDFAGLPPVAAEVPYFPADLVHLDADTVLVDCGAFDGDTLADLVRLQGGRFQRVWALEPDPENFRRLQERVAGYPRDVRRKIECLALAADNHRGQLRFSGGGTLSSSASAEGALTVACAPLDELLANDQPTYIKMDIEGAEPAALAGGRRLLQRHRPQLAISVYHQQDHLWQIPLQILASGVPCRFHLRRYNEECWDTVCYAIPM